jgi:hypothetical protein
VEDSLSIDQLEALAQIGRAKKHERPSACVARNAKTLTGLKYITHRKDGQLVLTEKGQQTLFVRRCIEGLRAIAGNPLAPLDADVAAFLNRKGHIAPKEASKGFEITQRGMESLKDIDATSR